MSAKEFMIVAGFVVVLAGALIWFGRQGDLPIQQLGRAVADAPESIGDDGRHRLTVWLPAGGMFGHCGVDENSVKQEFERRHPGLRFEKHAIESCVATFHITERPR